MKKGGSNKGEVREDVVGYDIFDLLPIMNASGQFHENRDKPQNIKSVNSDELVGYHWREHAILYKNNKTFNV